MTAPTAAGQVEISVAADVVYDLITDLTTMAEIADETTEMRWRKGASAAPGSVFKGTNRNGFRRWSTTCTVAEATPATRFTFDVKSVGGIPVARWQYDIESLPDGGCRVTDSRDTGPAGSADRRASPPAALTARVRTTCTSRTRCGASSCAPSQPQCSAADGRRLALPAGDVQGRARNAVAEGPVARRGPQRRPQRDGAHIIAPGPTADAR